jgi:hypothetical protein
MSIGARRKAHRTTKVPVYPSIDRSRAARGSGLTMAAWCFTLGDTKAPCRSAATLRFALAVAMA